MAKSNRRKSTKNVVAEVCRGLIGAFSTANATLEENDVSLEVLVELTALLTACLYADVRRASGGPPFRRHRLEEDFRVAPIVSEVLSSYRPDEVWRRDAQRKSRRSGATRAAL